MQKLGFEWLSSEKKQIEWIRLRNLTASVPAEYTPPSTAIEIQRDYFYVKLDI